MRLRIYKNESIAIEFMDIAGNAMKSLGLTIINHEDEDPSMTGPWNDKREWFVITEDGIKPKWKEK